MDTIDIIEIKIIGDIIPIQNIIIYILLFEGHISQFNFFVL